jgi:hypothetical protein
MKPALIEDYLVSVTIPQNEDETDNKIVQISVPENADISIQKSQRIQKNYGTPKKLLATVFVTVLTMAPLIAGFFVTSSLSRPSAFILPKKGTSSGLTITAVTSKLLNNPAERLKFQGEVQFCSSRSNAFECSTTTTKDEILVVDLSDTSCVKEMKKSIEEDRFKCLPYKGLVLLENWYHRSSSPYPLKVPSDVTEFPIVSVNSKDTTNKETEIFNNNSTYAIEISMSEYQDILEDQNSELYETNCENTKCLHMFESKENEKYLGCQGVPKLNVPIDLKCYDKGKNCSELITFKNVLKSKNPFKKCFTQEGINLVNNKIE